LSWPEAARAEATRQRARVPARRGLLVLAATWLLASCICASSRAEQLAFIKAGKVFVAEPDDSHQREVPLPAGTPYDVAFNTAGQLYVSITASSESWGCELYAAGSPTPLINYRDVGDPDGTGLCGLQLDPEGGLLFESSNGTLGSARIWKLDLATLVATPITYGYAPATTAGSHVIVVVDHRYFPGNQGGSYETLRGGALSQPQSIRPIVPQASRAHYFEYSAPALAPGGRRLAAALYDHRQTVVVGDLGRPLHRVWAPPRNYLVNWLGWTGTSAHILLAAVSRLGAATSDLLQITLPSGRTRTVVRGITTAGVGP
jgi:hypothetical protein